MNEYILAILGFGLILLKALFQTEKKDKDKKIAKPLSVAGRIAVVIGVLIFVLGLLDIHDKNSKAEQKSLEEKQLIQAEKARDSLIIERRIIEKNLTDSILSETQKVNSLLNAELLDLRNRLRKQLNETKRQSFPIPEKLYLGLELTFRFAEDVNYSKLLNSYTNIPSNVIFEMGIPTPEFKEVFSIVSKRLGILQITGSIKSSSKRIFSFNQLNEMKYKIDRNTNNIVEFYIPKEDNSTFGRLYYNIENQDYTLTIYMYPFSFGKVPNVTSLLDLDELQIELSPNFVSVNPSDNRAIQLIKEKNLRLFLKTESTTFAEIENIEILNNIQNNNRLQGKIKVKENY